MTRLNNAADLTKLRKKIVFQRSAKPMCVTICAGTGCRAYGAEAVAESFDREIEKRGLGHRVAIRRTGCHGFCERGPLVVIQPKGICYLGTQVKDVPEIVGKSVEADDVVERLLYLDETGKRMKSVDEIPPELLISLEVTTLHDPDFATSW